MYHPATSTSSCNVFSKFIKFPQCQIYYKFLKHFSIPGIRRDSKATISILASGGTAKRLSASWHAEEQQSYYQHPGMRWNSKATISILACRGTAKLLSASWHEVEQQSYYQHPGIRRDSKATISILACRGTAKLLSASWHAVEQQSYYQHPGMRWTAKLLSAYSQHFSAIIHKGYNITEFLIKNDFFERRVASRTDCSIILPFCSRDRAA